MNNNFYEVPNDWYSEFNMPPSFVSMPTNFSTNDLALPKVALERGNLFNNLYKPYKNYRYRGLNAKNPKEELLINILNHNFVITDLDLYLDLYPDDRNMQNYYVKILNSKKKLITEYENNYGPLTLEGDKITGNTWNWLKSPWPWEGNR